jgi:hypothetical protein
MATSAWHRSRAWGLWLLVLALGGAFAAFARPDARAPDAAAPLLDATIQSCADGKHLSFRLDRPGRVRVSVEGPEDAALRLEIGPALPLDERLGVWRPDPAASFRLDARGAGSVERRLDAVGTYVIRFEPIPTAMESMTSKVHVLVRRLEGP